MHKTVALGQVVLPRRHLKLENVHVLLQAIALECGALRLIRRELFVMMPVISTIYIYCMKCRASLAKWKKAASTKVCCMSVQISREICLP